MNRRRTKNKPRRRRRRGLAWRIVVWVFRKLADYWKRSRAAHRRRKKQHAREDIRRIRKIPPPPIADRYAKSFGESTNGHNRRWIDEPRISDAISALVNLGFSQPEAVAAIAAAVRIAGEGADTAILIRSGLKDLAR
jgi:hypothetical protein